jgi:hypothetical protein
MEIPEQRYQYLAIGRDNSYFVKSHSKSNNKYKLYEMIQTVRYICAVLRTRVSIDNQYFNEYKLCSTSR